MTDRERCRTFTVSVEDGGRPVCRSIAQQRGGGAFSVIVEVRREHGQWDRITASTKRMTTWEEAMQRANDFVEVWLAGSADMAAP